MVNSKKYLFRVFMTSCLLTSMFYHTSVQAIERLHIYSWADYIPDSLLTEFTKETGISIIYTDYDSNEQMYEGLKDRDIHYDLIVPSTYFVSRMRVEGLLQKLDHSKIPNFKNLDPQYLRKSYDYHNDYSVPYLWGATGIGINEEKYGDVKISKWGDLWDPRWKNQLLVTNTPRELFQLALVKLGFSGNTSNPDEIKAAYEELMLLAPNILMFDSINPVIPYKNGTVNIGMIWNGSAYTAAQSGAPIKLIWPEKGTTLWMDSFAIPKNAKNVEAAHQFINFMLEPKHAAEASLNVGFPTSVKAAYHLLPKEFMSNESVYPPQKVFNSGEWQDDVGESIMLYKEYFSRIKQMVEDRQNALSSKEQAASTD